MKKNNKGFSYVELMIVIAIMGIVVGLVSLSFTLVDRTNVAKAGDRLISVLNQGRTNALTKGSSSGYVYFTKKNGALYAYVGPQISAIDYGTQNWERISSRAIDVNLVGSSINEGDLRFVQFSQATGAPVAGISLSFVLSSGGKSCSVFIDAYTGKTTKQ